MGEDAEGMPAGSQDLVLAGRSLRDGCSLQVRQLLIGDGSSFDCSLLIMWVVTHSADEQASGIQKHVTIHLSLPIHGGSRGDGEGFDEAVSEMFNHFDVNGDGVIDYVELKVQPVASHDVFLSRA